MLQRRTRMDRGKPMARTEMARGSKPLKRSRIKAQSRATVAASGESARAVKAECDALITQIIAIEDEECFVCGVPSSQEDLHPGHYITRKVLALRWDRRNIRPQCNDCNGYHNEAPQWYRSMLLLDIGPDVVAELERIGKENPRVEYSELLTIRDGLRAELKDLI